MIKVVTMLIIPRCDNVKRNKRNSRCCGQPTHHSTPQPLEHGTVEGPSCRHSSPDRSQHSPPSRMPAMLECVGPHRLSFISSHFLRETDILSVHWFPLFPALVRCTAPLPVMFIGQITYFVPDISESLPLRTDGTRNHGLRGRLSVGCSRFQ